MKLYPHQEEGIQLIHKWKRCIVGDQMGCGKSPMSAVAIDRANAYPLLIICPSSLKPNWKIEFERWTGKTALILDDSIKNTFPVLYKSGLCHAFITNYESLSKYFVHSIPKDRKDLKLSDITFNNYKDFFKAVIFDEGHRVKDPKAIQSKLVRAICRGKEWILDLTGTPVMNKTTDLASQLCIIEQMQHFGGYGMFMQNYDSADKFMLADLSKRLKETCYFRREKKDVLNLPEKTRQKLIVDIDNRDEYHTALTDLRTYLREWKGKTDEEIRRSMRGEIVVKIDILKTISAKGKISCLIENVKDANENGEKVVIFGHHTETLQEIKKQLPGCVTILGSDATQQRQNNIESFQNNPEVKNIVCSIKAAGVGVTLTAARIVIFNEVWWNSAYMDQCEDRIHRIGQKNDAHCIYLAGRNTIDSWLYDLIEKKREVCDAVTGGGEDIDWGIINEVIELILENKT